MNAPKLRTSRNTGSHDTSRRRSRWITRGLVAAAVGLGAAGAGARADATLNPALTYSEQFGDCTLSVGTHIDPNPWAVAGATLPCTKRHSTSSARVHLWRWNGASWVNVRTSPWVTYSNSFGFGSKELVSPGFCGGSAAYWYESLEVSISGVGSRVIWTGTQGPWAPAAC